jgi:hypothetical protein
MGWEMEIPTEGSLLECFLIEMGPCEYQLIALRSRVGQFPTVLQRSVIHDPRMN